MLRVLGQVELRVDGRVVEVGHARQRCAPAGEVAIARQGGGYVLETDPEAVDVHRFRRLVEQARGEDDAQPLALLEEAAMLWRGDAFDGLDSPWISAVREGLARERFAADLDRVDLALARGKHAALSVELAERADAHPLDERVAGQLMLALYRNGRQAEALLRFDRISALLREVVLQQRKAGRGRTAPRPCCTPQSTSTNSPVWTISRQVFIPAGPPGRPRRG